LGFIELLTNIPEKNRQERLSMSTQPHLKECCASTIAPFEGNTECASHTAYVVGIWCFEKEKLYD